MKIPCGALHNDRTSTCVELEVVLRWFGADVAPNYLGEQNDLEYSEDCRSAGGHGNQHVRLRSAQIDGIKTICPAPQRSAASSRGRRRIHDFKAVAEAPHLQSPQTPLHRKSKVPRRLTKVARSLPRLFPWGGTKPALRSSSDVAMGCTSCCRTDRTGVYVVVLWAGNFVRKWNMDLTCNANRNLQRFRLLIEYEKFCRSISPPYC